MVLTTISACGVGCGRFQLKLRLIFRFCRRPLCSVRAPTGVQKTLSGLIKLVSPNPEIPVPDEVLEWAMRIALGCRRRVKEQQKRKVPLSFVTPSLAMRWAMTEWRSLCQRPSCTARAALAAILSRPDRLGFLTALREVASADLRFR